MRGLVIAAPASGSGKTVVTLGLLRALARRGNQVAGAKVGPDYIDPRFHQAAAGRPAPNLDVWAMRTGTIGRALALARGAQLMLAEGVMGLFDGIGAEGVGSTADLAALLGWPVILVLDARGAAASVAPVLRGFARHRRDVRIAGAIVNRVGGIAHADVAAEACQRACPDIALIGCLPRDPALALPERHLGLVQAGEHPDLAGFLDRAADLIERQLDLEQLLGLAEAAAVPAPDPAPPLAPLGQRIAVARDVAFAFNYPVLLAGWHQAGAEIKLFSPLAGEAPDPDADAVYLPGGYPELHAGALAAQSAWREGLWRLADAGAAIWGECGGYMALGRSLIDTDGTAHAMAGLLPLVASFAQRRLSLGYRQMRVATGGIVGPRGQAYRGHEFHYATVTEEGPGEPLFEAMDGEGRRSFRAGLVRGRVGGSFLHLIDRGD